MVTVYYPGHPGATQKYRVISLEQHKKYTISLEQPKNYPDYPAYLVIMYYHSYHVLPWLPRLPCLLGDDIPDGLLVV